MIHVELTMHPTTSGINEVGPWIRQFQSFDLECLSGLDWVSRCTKKRVYEHHIFNINQSCQNRPYPK